MTSKSLEQQLLLDAQEAGFKVFNGTIHLPAACDVMEAFNTLCIIRENRAIEPLANEIEKLKFHLSRYGNPHIMEVLMRHDNYLEKLNIIETNNSPDGMSVTVGESLKPAI